MNEHPMCSYSVSRVASSRKENLSDFPGFQNPFKSQRPHFEA